jgi:diacylglycerol kinase (ATP)
MFMVLWQLKRGREFPDVSLADYFIDCRLFYIKQVLTSSTTAPSKRIRDDYVGETTLFVLGIISIMTFENRIDTKREFSLLKRSQSFSYAGRGLGLFIKTTHNAWVHSFFFCLVIFLGFFFGITKIEWLILILAGGFVFSAEAFNTAIEIDIDLTSPEYHPYARDTKDVAAGAVLISAMVAVVIGLLIFVPYFLALI